MYRLNFNGQQVSRNYPSLAAARRALESLPDPRATWIQRLDPETGDWFAVPRSRT